MLFYTASLGLEPKSAPQRHTATARHIPVEALPLRPPEGGGGVGGGDGESMAPLPSLVGVRKELPREGLAATRGRLR